MSSIDVQDYYAFTPDRVRAFIDGRKASWAEANYVPLDPLAVLGLKGWKIRACEDCVFYQGNHKCQVVDAYIFDKGSSRFFLPKQKDHYSREDLQENLKITREYYKLPEKRNLFNLPYLK